MLVEDFGTIEAATEQIRKIKNGSGKGGKLIDIQEKMDALDDRVEVKELLKNIQADLPALEELLARCSEGWGMRIQSTASITRASRSMPFRKTPQRL